MVYLAYRNSKAAYMIQMGGQDDQEARFAQALDTIQGLVILAEPILKNVDYGDNSGNNMHLENFLY